MKLRRLLLGWSLVLSIIAFQGMSAFAAQGGNSATTPTASANSSDQVCDGDSGGKSDTGHGANQGDAYDNTCPAGPSGNGNGNGQATGKPCAGCVGQADDKNPQGQLPNGDDANNGYECDHNHGIARTNPAHTGCTTSLVLVFRFGAAAAITDLPCDDSTADVTVSNNDSTGTRNFTATVDGAAAGSALVIAGTSTTFTVTIPNDAAFHAVSVASNGTTLASRSLKVTSCTEVLGINFKKKSSVLGENFTRSTPEVLGQPLRRTGFGIETLLFVAIALISAGFATLVDRKKLHIQ
jgi:hypothetical protein